MKAVSVRGGSELEGKASDPSGAVDLFTTPAVPSPSVTPEDGSLSLAWTSQSTGRHVTWLIDGDEVAPEVTSDNGASQALQVSRSGLTNAELARLTLAAQSGGKEASVQVQGTPAGVPTISYTSVVTSQGALDASYQVNWNGHATGDCFAVWSGEAARVQVPCDRKVVEGLYADTPYTFDLVARGTSTRTPIDSAATKTEQRTQPVLATISVSENFKAGAVANDCDPAWGVQPLNNTQYDKTGKAGCVLEGTQVSILCKTTGYNLTPQYGNKSNVWYALRSPTEGYFVSSVWLLGDDPNIAVADCR